ncbi:MAG: nuclear transport factor 2 family protein [Proteobacteria bacterium]|nr:nuclear transport factor 2 family protein [Pseudomonadota bacterium]MDA1064821.1 nuclear transport factor 2 family protein [Pseudomonadota bacterium]
MKLIAQLRGTLFALCLLFVAGVFIHAKAEDAGSEAAVSTLTAMLHDFLANSGKADAHAKFWADDLVYTSSNGTRFGKADIMLGFDAPDDDEDAGPNVVYSGEDVKVQVFGNAAVITFRLVGVPDDGTAVLQYFNTGTFLQRDGEWRVVAWQATSISMAEESQ